MRQYRMPIKSHPLRAGDPCPNCLLFGDNNPLALEPGYPASWDDPGQADCLFCESCGLEFDAPDADETQDVDKVLQA